MGMKIRFMRKPAMLALAALIAATCACARKNPPANAAAATGSAAPENPAAVAEKKSIDAFGTAKAKIVRNINLDFPAVLEKRLVSDGQRVKKGDALFRFSSSAYESQIKSKSYELAAARYELKKSAMELVRLREDLQISAADVEDARRELANKESLLSMGAASQSDVEEYRRKLTAAEQDKRSLERSIESFTGGEVNGMEVQKAKISILETELAELQGQSAKSFISGKTIVSDVADGIVTEIGYIEGDYISKAKKVCGLLDLGSMIVEANIPEEFAKDAKVGSKAEVVPVADNTRTYTGTVTRISSMAVKSSGETVIPVEITVDGTDGFLLPNYSVDVKIY
jgi:HlyD family secretion protein